jgi:hypothetical protein
MVLAEEEPRQARPNLPWIWATAVGVVVLLGVVGLWAALRGRGAPAPEVMGVVSDSIAVAVPRDSLVADGTPSDSVEAQDVAAAASAAVAASSPPPVVARPVAPSVAPAVVTPPVAARPMPTPAPARGSPPAPRRDPDPAPTPAPRAEPARGDTVYRATTWVWLRAGPVNSAEQLGVVNPRQAVQVLERRFAWVRVRVDGQEGWMSADYLERVPD